VASTGVVCVYDEDHETPHQYMDCYDAYEAKPYFNRYCLPADEDKREEIIEYWEEPE